MMRRRVFVGSVMSAALTGVAWADGGHLDQGVRVIVTSVGPDALDPSKTAVGIQIDNDRSVDAILRAVQTNYGKGVMHRTVSLLGTTTRASIQFLAVNGGSFSVLQPPERQITVDEPFSPQTYYAFGFDFGPIGQIYAEWGEG